MPKETKAPSNVQLQNQIKDTNSRLDKILDFMSKQTEGVGVKQAVEPKPEMVVPTGGIPQKYRDVADKVLGKDFGLRLSDDDEMLLIVVPEKYSVYHIPGVKASYENHHQTQRVDEENKITRRTPEIADDVLKARLEKWDEKHPFNLPEDIRPIAFSLAVIGNQFEEYCQAVRKNIEKEKDIKLND